MPLEAIKPGATALTRTGAHSLAAVSEKFSMPARAAPECPMPGIPFHMSAMMLVMDMSFLPSCSIMCWLNTSRATRKPPVRLFRTTVSKPLPLIMFNGEGNWPPALLIRWSIFPCAARMSAMVSLTRSSSRMSQLCRLILTEQVSSISAFTVSSFSILRPTKARSAPRLANSCAVHRPIPEPPPVTTTVWPANRPGLKTDWKEFTKGTFGEVNGKNQTFV